MAAGRPLGFLWRTILGGNHMIKSTELRAFKTSLEHLRSRLRGDVNMMADEALRKTRAEASGDL